MCWHPDPTVAPRLGSVWAVPSLSPAPGAQGAMAMCERSHGDCQALVMGLGPGPGSAAPVPKLPFLTERMGEGPLPVGWWARWDCSVGSVASNEHCAHVHSFSPLVAESSESA